MGYATPEAHEKMIRDTAKSYLGAIEKAAKTGRIGDAVAWMRAARERQPDNMRILFNSAQMLINLMQQQGYSEELMIEANGVLMHVDALAPGQQRFAQLVEQLQELVPRREDAAATPADASTEPAE